MCHADVVIEPFSKEFLLKQFKHKVSAFCSKSDLYYPCAHSKLTRLTVNANSILKLSVVGIARTEPPLDIKAIV